MPDDFTRQREAPWAGKGLSLADWQEYWKCKQNGKYNNQGQILCVHKNKKIRWQIGWVIQNTNWPHEYSCWKYNVDQMTQDKWFIIVRMQASHYLTVLIVILQPKA